MITMTPILTRRGVGLRYQAAQKRMIFVNSSSSSCPRLPTVLALSMLLLSLAGPGWAKKHTPPHRSKKTQTVKKNAVAVPTRHDGQAEARLMEVYRLLGSGHGRTALPKAEQLVKDYPNFQLAQLVYGDLLTSRRQPVRVLGDVPTELAAAGTGHLQELRDESRLRLTALQERPPAGAIPSQFLSLSARNKHAIAIDVSKARLYLFENTPTGTQLLADYYISVGKAGTGKNVEGDQRTPLGVYFITSNLDPASLKDLYGSGALPNNYPNALDMKRGKTGSGIWLHGTPSAQFTRAPLATDGCVAVANPDLDRIIRTVEIRTTPVLIAPSLKWVSAQSLSAEKKEFSDVLQAWAKATSNPDARQLKRFYAANFTSDEKTLAARAGPVRHVTAQKGPGATRLIEVSYLRWTDESDFMIATFGEVTEGAKGGRTIRQYWQRQGQQWQIIYEAVVG